MIPELLDSNTYLLRDYSGFVKNLTDKLPNLTKKWTDFTVSEPDTIFLNNIAYINDLISYTIDFNYILTSVKYTSNRDFLNTICALTGSSVPKYSENYSLIINSGLSSTPQYIPKGTIIFDDSGVHSVITLKGVYILPNTETSVPVVLGNSYNSSILTRRNSEIRAQEIINKNTLYDTESFSLLDVETNSAKVFYNFILHGDEKYWVSQGDNMTCIMSPALAYKSYKFVSFSLEKENALADNSKMDYPMIQGTTTFSKTKKGSAPIDINDHKVAYLSSLDEIYTDINSNVFDHNLDYSILPGIDRLSLSFENNRNNLVSSSYIDYTEGYLEISGNLPTGSQLLIIYDYYNNDRGPSELYPHGPIRKEVDFLNFTTIDLELEENHTIKAFSLILKLTLPNGESLYLTDYHNALIVPRGNSYSAKFCYYSKTAKIHNKLDFSVGMIIDPRQTITKLPKDNMISFANIRIEKSGGEVFESKVDISSLTSETSDYYLMLLTQEAERFQLVFKGPEGKIIKEESLSLPAHNLEPVCISCPAGSYEIAIFSQGNLLYTVSLTDGNSYLMLDEDYLLKTNYLPNFVFHDNQQIYFLATNSNSLQNIFVDLDGQCSYQVFRNSPNPLATYLEYKPMPIKVNGINMGVNSLFSLEIPEFYTERFGVPRKISLTLNDKTYYSTDSNYSTDNNYSSLISTDVIRHTIDLYDIPTKLVAAKEIMLRIGALVYLKPLDLSNQIIFDLIKQSLSDYSENLQINEFTSSSAILSKIIHASDYIAYVELDEETVKQADAIRDQKGSLTDFIVQIDVENLNIAFKNSDILQF